MIVLVCVSHVPVTLICARSCTFYRSKELYREINMCFTACINHKHKDQTFSDIMESLFLYCCPDCLGCPAYAIKWPWAGQQLGQSGQQYRMRPVFVKRFSSLRFTGFSDLAKTLTLPTLLPSLEVDLEAVPLIREINAMYMGTTCSKVTHSTQHVLSLRFSSCGPITANKPII